MTDNTCNCDEFKKAREPGTDNEGYMAAICLTDNKTGFEIGLIENPIKFCPWCGKKVPERKDRK